MFLANVLQKLVLPFKQSSNQMRGILLVTVFIMLTGNLALFSRILEIYPLKLHNLPFLLSLALFFSILTAIFFLSICYGKATRWVLAVFLVIVALAAYYMDHYKVIVDIVMIDNIIHTDSKELAGVLSLGLLFRALFFGIIPAWLVIKYFPKSENTRSEFKSRLPVLGILVLSIVLLVVPFTASYASFWREHKITRFYANPTYSIYSIIKYITQQLSIAKVGPLHALSLIHISLQAGLAAWQQVYGCTCKQRSIYPRDILQ